MWHHKDIIIICYNNNNNKPMDNVNPINNNNEGHVLINININQ